ncbi:MAG: DUF4870 domain-containing protein [Anaerolineae bacterium]|nr:DUF4870 domain-containing protein [Anaerolineae bacterium]
MAEEQMSPDVTSDDKLWAALAYAFSPLVPIIALLLEDKKERPYIKLASVQALAWSVVYALIGIILSATLILACIVPFIWVVQLYWAYLAYQGQDVNIPIISDFVKNQGWV